MSKMQYAHIRPTPFYIQALAILQKWVRKSSLSVKVIRASRNVIYYYFGRFWVERNVGEDHGLLSKTIPPDSLISGEATLAEIIDNLKQYGMDLNCSLRADTVPELTHVIEHLSDGTHVDIHRKIAVFSEIVEDSGILAVVTAFLNKEPVLLESKLSLGRVLTGAPLTTGFHFDHTGCPSLNVMVYLSDIDTKGARHVAIEGSQKEKFFSDLCREYLPIDQAERRFADRIHSVTGPAGTLIFENTEIFHMRLPGAGRRALLNMVFSTRPKRLLSQGRNEAQV
jgi:hypothetical protein